MDISVHPAFATNNFVYLAYAYNADGKRIKVMRYKYAGGKLTEPKVIIENIPGAPNHAGMRARFGPDGKLYVTAGDSTDWNLAQDNNSLAGKTLRLNDDGTVPADNPFVKKEGYRPEIWSRTTQRTRPCVAAGSGLCSNLRTAEPIRRQRRRCR